MADVLLELLSEEIPARMQDRAREDLARLFGAELAKAGLPAPGIVTYATPRRLALIARDLPGFTAAVREETKGPRVGAPPQALEGFLRKTGLTADQLIERDGVLFAIVERPGRAVAEVLAEAIPAIVRGFPWPKSMRWGEGSLRWVRPLHGIVAILGQELVPCAIEGIASGYATRGHRFHHPGPITIGGADDYVEKLRACHVIVDQDERRALIRTRAAALAAEAGLRGIEDEGLVAENAGLTEWPVPLLGAFDPDFLEVPREVIQLTMRTNQKYFALTDGAGRLAPNFLCTANIDAEDGGEAIIAGNRKVLAARLSDARFFWQQDLKVPLEEQAKKLAGIVFHEKLGTVADKVDRVAKLARWLVEEGIVKSSPVRGGGPAKPVEGGKPQAPRPIESPLHHPADGPPPRAGEDRQKLADMAEQAARLCKADLVTGMVGEFPELQGVMGGYYARAEGLPDEVADAIRDHYKPVGQGDEVPTAPVTVAVSLADKLDTLVGFFLIQDRPSGSRDPYALRRAAISVIALILRTDTKIDLLKAVMQAGAPYIASRLTDIDRTLRDKTLDARKSEDPNFERIEELNAFRAQLSDREGFAALALGAYQSFVSHLLNFFADRLKVQQREAGVRHDLIDAVFALGGEDDLVRLLARVKALQAFVGTEDGANLLAGYKRAANILRKEGWPPASAARDEAAPMAEAHEQGIAQTGEEDPLVLVDDPIFAEVVADLVGQPLSPNPRSQGERGLAAEEAALLAALDAAEPRAEAAVAAEDFEGAMAALASLRTPIDRFFEAVTVNDSDPAIRARRLDLLARVRAAVHRVADFSKIEG